MQVDRWRAEKYAIAYCITQATPFSMAILGGPVQITSMM
jgi:hypothetical protein